MKSSAQLPSATKPGELQSKYECLSPEPPGRRGVRAAILASLLCFLILAVAGCDSGDREGTRTRAVVTAVTESVLPKVSPEPTQPMAVPTVTTASASATPEPPLAARVNGQPILLADYELRLTLYVDALIEQGLEPGTEEGQAQLAQVESDVLESLIDVVLLEQGGRDLGVTVGDEEVDAQVEKDISEGGGQDAFDEWLAMSGLNVETYRRMLRESLVAQRVMEVIAARVPERVEHAHARHIVAGTLDEAEQILAQLQEGADFAELARQHSLDESTRDDGGDLGWFPRGLLAVELEEAAFGLEEGQVSGVIPLGEGFHIVKVVDRDSARELAPESRMELVLALFDGWLDEQRLTAKIERNVTD